MSPDDGKVRFAGDRAEDGEEVGVVGAGDPLDVHRPPDPGRRRCGDGPASHGRSIPDRIGPSLPPSAASPRGPTVCSWDDQRPRRPGDLADGGWSTKVLVVPSTTRVGLPLLLPGGPRSADDPPGPPGGRAAAGSSRRWVTTPRCRVAPARRRVQFRNGGHSRGVREVEPGEARAGISWAVHWVGRAYRARSHVPQPRTIASGHVGARPRSSSQRSVIDRAGIEESA
jgi:hypothetical protein